MKSILNLIRDRWIPVQSENDTIDIIAPWEITRNHTTTPAITIITPRPDFDGSLVQFLIGLCQTVLPPEDDEDWRELLFNPPEPAELKAAFEPIADAFNLYGSGPRFMQETGLEDGKTWPIDNLLIDMPEASKNSDNTDWFVKRGLIETLCPACTAMALYTLQTNAPGGGRGHMTSMRGGGPMTTLILGPTLWQTVWANVIVCDSDGNPAVAEDVRRFPWMGPIRTSEGKEVTTPKNAHPDQAFWGIPRRILLDEPKGDSQGICSLCGAETDRLAATYQAKPYGVKYAGWVHPLSPYYSKGKAGAELLPLHPQPGGITYLDWLGLVINDPEGGSVVARNVTQFARHNRPGRVRELFAPNGGKPRLWAFGYDMDNKKPRCYYQGTMPIVSVDGDWQAEFEELAAGMIRATEEMARNVRWCIKVALFDNPADAKGDLSVISARFYQATEEDFYRLLDGAAVTCDNEEAAAIRREWYNLLGKTADQLFDDYSQINEIDEIDARRAVNARRLLRNPFSKSNKKIRGYLGIPDPQKQKKGEKKK